MSELCRQLESIDWHDSAFLGMDWFETETGATTIILHLEIIDWPGYKTADVVLEGCQELHIDMNLLVKRQASHHIATARCEPHMSDNRSGLKLSMQLVHPAGKLHIVASGVHIRWP